MIANKNYSIRFEKGIMTVTYKCKMLDLEIAKSIIKDRIELSNNQNQYILADATSIKYWDSKARNFMGEKENQKFLGPCAFIIRSSLILNLITWFISIFSISNPIKFFKENERDEAFKWLMLEKSKDPLHKEN